MRAPDVEIMRDQVLIAVEIANVRLLVSISVPERLEVKIFTAQVNKFPVIV